ncbi:MAG: DUF2336 domain-containing protein [Pseudomonadota bacterium]
MAAPQSLAVLGLVDPAEKDADALRAVVLRRLTDLAALPSGRLTRNERYFIAEVLMFALRGCSLPERVEVARRAASIAEPPPALLRELLIDDAAVAEPLILGAEAIPEHLLTEAARRGDREHRAAIARRPDITTAVVDALVEEEEEEVLLAVLRSMALLSTTAVERMAALAINNTAIRNLLIEREELEPLQGYNLFWPSDRESRRRILQRFSIDRRVIQDVLADLVPAVFRGRANDEFLRDLMRLIERRHRPRGRDGNPVSMSVVKRTLRLAITEPTPEHIHSVALVAGVDPILARRIVEDPGGEAFSIMAKATGIDRAEYIDVCRVFDDEEADARVQFFDITARDFARTIIRTWNWADRLKRRASKSGDPLLDGVLTL